MQLLDNLLKKHTKANVKEQQSFLGGSINDFFNSAPLAIHFFDAKGNLIDCNQAALQLCDIDDKNDYIRNFFMFMPFNQPDGKRSRDVLMNSILEASENKYSDADITFRKSDGTSMIANNKFVSYEHGADTVIVMFSTQSAPVVVSAPRDTEADLRATLMLDSTPIACFLADSRCNAIDCNAEALQLFGHVSKIEATKRFSDICPQTQMISGQNIETMNDAINKALVSGRYVFEFTCFDATGKPIPCNVTLVRIYSRGEYVVAIYIQDLRETRALIAEMKRIDIAEEENRAKSRFLAKMSHEIRTPLTSILGLAEVQLLMGENTSEMEDVFLQIYTSSNLLLRIINDLLDLSKVEAEKMSILAQIYRVHSFVSDTVQLNMVYIGDKKIDFEIEVDPNVPASLVGDELRIKQVMNNLLSNAFKYTNDGTIKLSIEAEVSSVSKEIVLVIRVQDTGIGMTKEQLDSLFEDEYVRFNEEVNYKIQGAGLGLSITHQLVTMMGGTISVSSEPNVGTQVVVKLPQEMHGNELLGPETSRNLGNLKISQLKRYSTSFVHKHLPHGRVLVVDDTKSNLHVIKSMLAPYALQIETADSGFEAIDNIKAGKVYDIIFMDHMMPELDGIATSKQIFALGYTNPIAALTANALVGQAEIFMKNGFSDFLSKPINLHELDACISRFVPQKAPVAKGEESKVESTNTISKGLADAFRQDAQKAIDILENLVNIGSLGNEDVKQFTITVHGIKSALLSVGKTPLSEKASELEMFGKDMDAKTFVANTTLLIDGLKEIVNEI